MKKNKSLGTKIAAVAGIAGVIVGGFAGALLFPTTNVEVQTKDLTAAQAEAFKAQGFEQGFEAGESSVTPTIINNTITEIEYVEVDNGNLDAVLHALYLQEGDFGIVLDGLAEDELDVVVERVAMANDFKAMAENVIVSTLARDLDRQWDADRRDVSRIKVLSEDMGFTAIDFDKEDATITVPVEFRYKGDFYEATVIVEFYDGKALPIEIMQPTLQ